jgi:pimeloyl-ACP methyl ester carboxylesterase
MRSSVTCGSTSIALAGLLLSCPATRAAHFIEGDLPRQAELGFMSDSQDSALIAIRVAAAGPAAKAGLREGAHILAINGRPVARTYEAQAQLAALKGGQRVELEVSGAPLERTNAATRRITYTAPPRAFEDVPGLDSYYGVVDTRDGSRLRTIVTRPGSPDAQSKKWPVILLTQWVSCSSLEFSRGGLSREILKTLALRSGAALIRVERAGTGDSIGPACHELDYDTEVSHYREALDATLAHYSWLDPQRLIIYGSSLGATEAPLVAADRRVAGLIVQGGGALTYLERMINFDRLQLERSNVPPEEFDERMRRQTQFNVEYLIKGRSPDDIVRDGPAMVAARSGIRGLGDGEHYGRPYAWHMQAAHRDLAAAWSRIDAPVLVLYGEFDQFETRHGHELIAEIVNRRHAGRATFIAVPRMDHEGNVYDTVGDAYAERNPVSGPPERAQQLQIGPMLRWLRDVVGFPVTSD